MQLLRSPISFVHAQRNPLRAKKIRPLCSSPNIPPPIILFFPVQRNLKQNRKGPALSPLPWTRKRRRRRRRMVKKLPHACYTEL